jgi:hypothetical protein
MDAERMIGQLKVNAQRIGALLIEVTQEESQWKPDADSWSILEVVNHLYDEEREDFRVRLNIILHQPDEAWPPIDPQGWVVERRYNDRNLADSTRNFLEEREYSLNWLQELGETNWDTEYTSPFGSMQAGDMFCAWVAHDQLHMRQLVELHRGLIEQQVVPFDLSYAGDW